MMILNSIFNFGVAALITRNSKKDIYRLELLPCVCMIFLKRIYMNTYLRLSRSWYDQCACDHYGNDIVTINIDGVSVRLCGLCRMLHETNEKAFMMGFYKRIDAIYDCLPSWLFNDGCYCSKEKLKEIRTYIDDVEYDSAIFNEFLLKFVYPGLWDIRCQKQKRREIRINIV